MTGPGTGGPFPVIRDADRVRRLAALPTVRPHALQRLEAATVAVVGVGGLGSGAAPYLAAAGVGTLRLIDPGTVAATDLGRQILYTPRDIGRPKVDVMSERLHAQNPTIAIHRLPTALDAGNVSVLLGDAQVVVDGLDAGPARDVLNRWAVETNRPVIFAGALGYEGQVMAVAGHETACLACLFGTVADAPGECAVDGVLGPLVGLIGAWEAAEALKLIMGLGQPLMGHLLQVDLYTGTTRVLAVPPRANCPLADPAGRRPRG